MNESPQRMERLSDGDAAALLRATVSPCSLREELEAIAALPPRELWEILVEQCRQVKSQFTKGDAAHILGIKDHTLQRWLRTREPAPLVCHRMAALFELVWLCLHNKLASVSERELRTAVSMLRGLSPNADDHPLKEVLCLLTRLFGEPNERT